MHLFGRVLEGGRPPGHAGGVPELGLQGSRVELEDDPVDLVDEVVAVIGVAGDVGLPFGATAHDRVVGGDGQAPAGEQVVPLVLLTGQLLPRSGHDGADAVGDHGQGPRGRHRRILLTQRARRGVTGVGEDLQQGTSPGLPLEVLAAATLVEGVEVRHREVDLTADLQEGRVGLPRQNQRHRFDGAHVPGDVLSDGTVSASRGTGQHAVLICQCHRQTIDLDLGRHGQLVIGHLGRGHDPFDPFLDLLEVENVLQGVEVLVVADLGEIGGHAPADRPGGRARKRQRRVGGLERLQLTVERVVLGIGPGALSVDGDVVGVAGALDVAHELGPAGAGGGGDRGEIGDPGEGVVSRVGPRPGGSISHGAYPPSFGAAHGRRSAAGLEGRRRGSPGKPGTARSACAHASPGRGRRRSSAAIPPSRNAGSSQASTASSGRTTGSRECSQTRSGPASRVRTVRVSNHEP